MRTLTSVVLVLMLSACADEGWIPMPPGGDRAEFEISDAHPAAAPGGPAGQAPSKPAVDAGSPVGSSPPGALLVGAGLLELTFAALPGSGVEGVSFTIGAVACPGGDEPAAVNPVSGKQPLEPMPLPGGDPPDPLSPLAGHRFADIFTPLDPGCYEISVLPLDAAGAVLEDCSAGYLPLVEVLPGQTTEVLLVSQCAGDAVGGLDVIAAINHAPEIDDFWFDPSKFVLTCEAARLCASATDPDGDPLEFSWAVLGDPPPAVGPQTVENFEVDGVWTNCIEVATDQPSSLEVGVTVYDRLSPAFGGGRIEDLLADQGGGASHASLTVPLHTGADIYMWCVERDGSLSRPDGMRRVDKHPSCSDTPLTDVFCDDENPDADEECPGGQFDPARVFDPCVCAECTDGVNALQVRWNGPGEKRIVVTDGDGEALMDTTLQPGQEFAFQGRGPLGKMGDSVSLSIGDDARIVIPTDCTSEIPPGTAWGGLEIVDGSSCGGPFCVFPPGPDDLSLP